VPVAKEEIVEHEKAEGSREGSSPNTLIEGSQRSNSRRRETVRVQTNPSMLKS